MKDPKTEQSIVFGSFLLNYYSWNYLLFSAKFTNKQTYQGTDKYKYLNGC